MADDPERPPQQKLNIKVPDDQRHGTYANLVVTTNTAHEFTLDFCQVQPAEDGRATAEVVSRVRIPPTLVARTMQQLNAALTRYEERFGTVRALP